ncbi:SRPBCC family protein [Mycetocola zhadangensis]|uniref:SRPBCC family protein n=1 Tax=Mycetocola zhadangensis TaxID=1164595 RepID=A0A3L7ISS1_9MICO|nr:SRPBCC family protein [Mycetocola zhadangensis]RLQ81274.1 SRPBCC family protein [Mycetocola zhadangensis]GGF03166.1 hypothetical protein GCM10011313_27860 [Mycetocola zhadangensis]
MPEPTGHISQGRDLTFELTLTRRFDAPAAEVWASLTDPAQTAEWLGPWRGTPGVGNTVELQMAFEEGDSWSAVRIDECDAPHRISVSVTVSEDISGWDLEVTLAEQDGETELTFVHRLDDPAAAESIGPGWEYYLDMLVAARTGTERPEFDDYYPSQVVYYTKQANRVLTE